MPSCSARHPGRSHARRSAGSRFDHRSSRPLDGRRGHRIDSPRGGRQTFASRARLGPPPLRRPVASMRRGWEARTPGRPWNASSARSPRSATSHSRRRLPSTTWSCRPSVLWRCRGERVSDTAGRAPRGGAPGHPATDAIGPTMLPTRSGGTNGVWRRTPPARWPRRDAAGRTLPETWDDVLALAADLTGGSRLRSLPARDLELPQPGSERRRADGNRRARRAGRWRMGARRPRTPDSPRADGSARLGAARGAGSPDARRRRGAVRPPHLRVRHVLDRERRPALQVRRRPRRSGSRARRGRPCCLGRSRGSRGGRRVRRLGERRRGAAHDRCPRPVASPAAAARGRTRRSTRPPEGSSRQRSAPSSTPGCGRATRGGRPSNSTPGPCSHRRSQNVSRATQP